MLETVGTAILLTIIVWIVYRYYGSPESEYLNVLETLKVNDFSHLETDEIKEQIEKTEKNLKKIDINLKSVRKKKVKNHTHFSHRIESIKLSLLTYELTKRECEKRED